MRICMVFDDDYPWDVRVERTGRALTGGGHEVFLACRNRKRSAILVFRSESMMRRAAQNPRMNIT